MKSMMKQHQWQFTARGFVPCRVHGAIDISALSRDYRNSIEPDPDLVVIPLWAIVVLVIARFGAARLSRESSHQAPRLAWRMRQA